MVDLRPTLSHGGIYEQSSDPTSQTLTSTSPVPGPSSSSSSSSSSVTATEPENDPPVRKQGAIGGPDWYPTNAIWVIIATICTITLVVALDATSISVALPIIASKLHGTAIEAFWAGTSFLLSSTVFQPAFASFSQIFGRKPLLLIAITLFTIGCIIGGVAENFSVLLAGRTIQGIGGGGMLTVTEILITDLVPLRYRGGYMGIVSSMWALGSVAGPIMGGGFAQNVTWRWILWINLPFAGVSFVMIPLFLKLNQRVEGVGGKLRRVDWVGVVVFVGSMTAVLIPITWGGVMYDWGSWRTVVPLVVGFVGLIGFAVWEIYGAKEPMIALEVFMNRTAAVNYFGTFAHGIILWCMLYYLPLYYEGVKDLSPIMAGVAVFPQTFTVTPASITVGILVTLTGRFRWSLWAGWVFTTAGTGIMYLLDVHTSTVKWIFLNLLGGLGTGMLFPSMGFAIQASSSDENMSIAVAMFSFIRSVGQAFGVAIGGVIFQNALKKELAKFAVLDGRASELTQDAVAIVQVIKGLPKESELRMALVEGYAKALKPVWLAMMGFAAAAMLLAFATEKLDINRELKTEQGLREKKKKVPEGEKGDVKS